MNESRKTKSSAAAQEIVGERPDYMPPLREHFPPSLVGLTRYTAWRAQQRDGKWRKPPLNGASSTNPGTWLTLDDAMAYVDRGQADGVNVATGDGILVLDFDGCINKGKLAPVARDAMRHFNSYTEVSPTGTGIHIFLRVDPEFDAGITVARAEGCEKVEVFDGEHFCSITGHRVGKAEELVHVSIEEMEAWLAPFRAKPKQRQGQTLQALTDDRIIDLLGSNKSFKKLWIGDESDYDANHSSADGALACHIARYTRDEAQIRRIMERSGLQRAKWSEPRPGGGGDWLGYEIRSALDEVSLTKFTAELPPYERRDDGMYENFVGRAGEWVSQRLSNFTAQLIAIDSVDRGDGSQPEAKFVLTWTHEGRTGQVTVTANDFGQAAWPQTYLATAAPTAHVFPDCRGEKFKAAVLQTSPQETIEQRRKFGRIGWFPGVGYVTNSGVITAEGLDATASVELASNFRHYHLPAPPTGDRLLEAIGADLALLDFRSHSITFPLLAAVFGSVLGNARLTMHLVGQPGSGKTETASLLMRHWGVGFTSNEPTATWNATANALIGLLATCADAPLLVDDLIVDGDKHRVSHVTNKLDEVVGAVGNGQGRDRCDRTGRPMPSPVLRGLLLSTGEGWMARESRTARTVQIGFGREDLNGERYQAVKDMGERELFAESMSAFIQWCASRLPELRSAVSERIAVYERLEAEQNGGRHTRYGKTTGWLIGSFEVFTRFAMEEGAIDEDRRRELDAIARAVITNVVDKQADSETSARPHRLFLDSLAIALTTGQARLDNIDGGTPKVMPKALGWVDPANPGELTGWVDGETVYLLPSQARAAAIAAAPNGGVGIPEAIGLGQAMQAAGLLTKVEKSHNAPKVAIKGVGRPRVWCLKLCSIVECDGSEQEF